MSDSGKCPFCEDRKKIRTPEERKRLTKRLSIAEGQIRGIKKMIEEDAYCPDIMTQISAVTAALNSFNRELLCQHISSCVYDDIRAGKEDAVEELLMLLKMFMR